MGFCLPLSKYLFVGNTKVIENIVIDTGAAETIISPDAVEDIGIFAELEDSVNSFYGVGGSLHNFFSKNVVKVKLGEASLEEVKMDFGVIDPQGNINGLLGLDLLMELGADRSKKIIINIRCI
ncbi:aspartyl protease family protein [Desulfosporosinus nitroreducens]|uniref:aspartyl protease family protein n=1 Tax=Desulfosporosinus nitroreducens TaxID=2018668 RepID=UPI00207CEC6E|nr:aspartyl protease family protein [Desulfosporosinus nitroreducens]MCO1602409.1 aspartyl protease family protein [Desulfosporosinus nitroreducens]